MIANTTVNQKSVCTATWNAAVMPATIAVPIVDPSMRLAASARTPMSGTRIARSRLTRVSQTG